MTERANLSRQQQNYDTFAVLSAIDSHRNSIFVLSHTENAEERGGIIAY